MEITYKTGMRFDVSVLQFTAKLEDRRESAMIAHADRKAKRIAVLVRERYGKLVPPTAIATLATGYGVVKVLVPYVVARVQLILGA